MVKQTVGRLVLSIIVFIAGCVEATPSESASSDGDKPDPRDTERDTVDTGEETDAAERGTDSEDSETADAAAPDEDTATDTGGGGDNDAGMVPDGGTDDAPDTETESEAPEDTESDSPIDTETAPPVIVPPKIIFPPFDRAVVGESYLYKIMAEGDPEPRITVEGTLPEGITFDGTDLISGIPTEAGTFANLTVVATNGPDSSDEQTFALTVFPEPTVADAVLADPTAAGDSDGHTWETAFPTIQEAVDAAAAQDRCCVFAAGSFTTDAAEPVLTMADGVFVFGGFEGYAGGDGAMESLLMERDSAVHQTTITGSDTALRTVIGADMATLDGFTVMRTGMQNDGVTIRITGCTFTKNNGCAEFYVEEESWEETDTEGDMDVYDDGYITCAVYGRGGALSNNNSNVIVDNDIITDNATTVGAGIYSEKSRVFVSETAITDHSEPEHGLGSGMYNLESIVYVEESIIDSNMYMDGSGIGVYNKASRLRMIRSSVSNNQSVGGSGGMVSIAGSKVTLFEVDFINNYGEFGTGAVNNYESEMRIERCRFVGNRSYTSSAVGNSADAVMHIEESLFVHNYDADGTNRNIVNEGALTIENCAFVDNRGGVENTGGTVTMHNAAFYLDKDVPLHNTDGEMKLTNVTVFKNGLEADAGAMQNDGASSVRVVNSILWGNGNDTSVGVMSSDETDISFAFSDIEQSGGSDDWAGALGTDLGDNIDATPGFSNAPHWTGTADGTDERNVFVITDAAHDIEVDDFITIDDETALYLVTDVDGATLTVIPDRYGWDLPMEDLTVTAWTYLDFLGLPSDSPCIDTGDDAEVVTDLDLLGTPRIADGGRFPDQSPTVDLGAVEYPGASL